MNKELSSPRRDVRKRPDPERQPGRGPRNRRVHKKSRANAIESMVQYALANPSKNGSGGGSGDPLPDSLVVRLSMEETSSSSSASAGSSMDLQSGTIDDGVHSLRVLILPFSGSNSSGTMTDTNTARATSGPCMIRIRSFICTDGMNPNFRLPLLFCLTNFKRVSPSLPTPAVSSSVPPYPLWNAHHGEVHRIKAGWITSFLRQHGPTFTNDDWKRSPHPAVQKLLDTGTATGTPPPPTSPKGKAIPPGRESTSTTTNASNNEGNDDDDDTVDTHSPSTVQSFWTHYTAMTTLQTSTQPPNCSPDHTLQNYTSALKDFAVSQLDRQTTSLTKNAAKEDATRAALLSLQHKNALQLAVNDESSQPLQPEKLCRWHGTLLQDLNPLAGQVRSKVVRTGAAVYCRPDMIDTELEAFCTGLSVLQHRLDRFSNVHHAVLFAAVVMFGVVDIHPFADGNGRVSRIAANWALRHFPFTINLFATPAQREEYVLAIVTTRHLLSFSKTYGPVPDDALPRLFRALGIFSPIVKVLMDRIGRTVTEFNRVWQEKSGRAAEALEDKAARQARERAQQGSCIICLDDNPNIATLCCGKAVHMNCIAEWLSAQTCCPCCRSEMPSISPRVLRAATSAAANEEAMRQEEYGGIINVDDGTEEGDTTVELGPDPELIRRIIDGIHQRRLVIGEAAEEDTESTEEEGTTTVVEEIEDETEEDETEQDETEDDTTTTVDDDTTTVYQQPAAQANNHRRQTHCTHSNCRNLAAVDCTNTCCGRCCVLGGQYHCPRHSPYG